MEKKYGIKERDTDDAYFFIEEDNGGEDELKKDIKDTLSIFEIVRCVVQTALTSMNSIHILEYPQTSNTIEVDINDVSVLLQLKNMIEIFIDKLDLDEDKLKEITTISYYELYRLIDKESCSESKPIETGDDNTEENKEKETEEKE